MRGFRSRGEVVTPKQLGIDDVSSKPRHPQIRMVTSQSLPRRLCQAGQRPSSARYCACNALSAHETSNVCSNTKGLTAAVRSRLCRLAVLHEIFFACNAMAAAFRSLAGMTGRVPPRCVAKGSRAAILPNSCGFFRKFGGQNWGPCVQSRRTAWSLDGHHATWQVMVSVRGWQ
ncbi:hypothetical protein EDB85DRAFT_671648 [Lactarius pseudohatsudake]|nr:hypothetical protein EDB85DRAFT_671648 [Lactarius pseudohatsudake]